MGLSNPDSELGVNSELGVKSIPREVFGDYFVTFSIARRRRIFLIIDATNMIFLHSCSENFRHAGNTLGYNRY